VKAVLFRSDERYEAFQKKMHERGIDVVVLDFDSNEWLKFNFKSIDLLVYYPSFQYSSNYPLTLWKVQDNLSYIKSNYPHLKMYPDPGLFKYYNDKYKQYLFLNHHNFPIPPTIPLLSKSSLDVAAEELGFPMVLKNRFGAGGDNVFKVDNFKELQQYYHISTFNFWNFHSIKYFFNIFTKRISYYFLIKEKKMNYPFLSPPLLAQKFISHNRDLKTVVRDNKVVEAHWRGKANSEMWKVNIDGGGIGEWTYVPEKAIRLSSNLAKKLNSTWLNIDLMPFKDDFFISEFSPVWHHYAYKENEKFIYSEDYNLDIPLDKSLDLENLILESLIN